MDDSERLVERPADGVMLIRLNRPARLNALSKRLLVTLAATLHGAAADDGVRAVVLTDDPIDAAQALAFGMVAEIVEPGDTVARAVAVAARIAGHSPLAVRLAKEEVLMAFQRPLDESLSLERKMLLFQSEDRAEGVQAFIEKRQPVWRGR